jgi:ectoine hydroxylase-related dioxygenase (phytanoyl-CoA dioxygenase family)
VWFSILIEGKRVQFSLSAEEDLAQTTRDCELVGKETCHRIAASELVQERPASLHRDQDGATTPYSDSLNSLAWPASGPDHYDDKGIISLRKQLLEGKHGIGFETVSPGDSGAERAAALFHRDGFVVVRDALDAAQLQALQGGCERVMHDVVVADTLHTGNSNGRHRYCFGSSYKSGHLSHVPEWAMLVGLPTVDPILARIMNSSDFSAFGMGGSFNMPGAAGYQPLHSDTGGTVITADGQLSDYRDAPVALVTVHYLPQALNRINGPIRQIPAALAGFSTQSTWNTPPTLEEEPEEWKSATLHGVPAGSAVIRDVRAWHGGTPNLSREARAMPAVLYSAPWHTPPGGFQRTMPHAVWEALPPRAQQLCTNIAAVPGERVDTGLCVRGGTFGNCGRIV